MVSNCLGSVDGAVRLNVIDEDGESENKKKLDFETRPMAIDEFGEYVSSLHSCSNNTFILQYQVCIKSIEWLAITILHVHYIISVCKDYGYLNLILYDSIISHWYQERMESWLLLDSLKITSH